MPEITSIRYPRPALVLLPAGEWKLIAGHAYAVALNKWRSEWYACPGARHCEKLILWDRVAFRLRILQPDTYHYVDLEDGKLVQKTIKLDSPAIGRHFPNLGLIVITKDGKPVPADEAAEVISSHLEGELIDDLSVNAYGYAALNGNGKPDSVFNILKNEKHIYWGYTDEEAIIKSRTHCAECSCSGDADCHNIEESTAIDSKAVCLAIPRLTVRNSAGDSVLAVARWCISYTRYCDYRGGDCDWKTECWKAVLKAHKDGKIEGIYTVADADEVNYEEILEEAV